MKDKPMHSLVVPVYNSEKSLTELYERIVATYETRICETFEIIFIDDYSADNSWNVLKKLRSKDSRVKIIQLMRNFGQHNAIICGFNNCKGDYVITLDDDLQNPPEEIPKLLEKIRETDVDIVIGQPIGRKEHSLLRNFGSYIIKKTYKKVFNKPENLYMGNFRIISYPIIRQIILNKTPHPVIGPMILKTTSRITNVPVEHHKRIHGRSTYNIAAIVKLTLDVFVNYSTIPLKIISSTGFFFALLSTVGGTYILIKRLLGFITVPGWTSLVLISLFFSGLNMMAFGIVGEYLTRIINEITFNPQYIIREQDCEDCAE